MQTYYRLITPETWRTWYNKMVAHENCCDAEREFAARHSEGTHADVARIVNVCLILDRRAPCGPGYGQRADAPDECDVDGPCGRHLRTPAVAERYVRLRDRALARERGGVR